jgi:anaerobic magnesium-protoporphyrin IX monomethyl ester cyclase
VESGSDRILGLMRKGTTKAVIRQVLTSSHAAGIRNVAYIMFGFPTETGEEFVETIQFLKNCSSSIDLVSTSVFGLQKGTPVFDEPSKFGIATISEAPRKILEPLISYETLSGMTHEEARQLRSNYRRTLQKLDRYPKYMNFWREHMLNIICNSIG